MRRLGAVARIADVMTVFAIGLGLVGCDAGPATTPAITPGTASNPRAVVIVAKDYTYSPPVVDLVPGETVVLQVVNGGLTLHEVVIGSGVVQDAWEAADVPFASAPPGVEPQVSVPPELGGIRILVRSGARVDATWTVPVDAAASGAAWFVGCHIPGHWSEGMVVPIRFVGPGGVPLVSAGGSSGSASSGGSVVR